MGYSGAGEKLIHEKNQKQKSRDTVPPLKVHTQACDFFGSDFEFCMLKEFYICLG
jgi:hypothetical protein